MHDYLREVTGQDFTAQDMCTWAGTVLAACAFRALPPPASNPPMKEQQTRVAGVIAVVAAQLGHTPAVCCKCYVHPDIIAAYGSGTLPPADEPAEASAPDADFAVGVPAQGLSADEQFVLRLLQEGAFAATAQH